MNISPFSMNTGSPQSPYGSGIYQPAGNTQSVSAFPGQESDEAKKANGRTNSEECETCKKRKYQDASNEMVSFKNAAHISPNQAGAAVRAHEQEHVKNAYSKASTNNGKVINASVSIHTSICPECGRSYVSGGTTNTQIKYYNEESPYQKALKTQDHTKYAGMNTDFSV